MQSNNGTFWDQRYCTEGAIWGNSPSPTALMAVQYLCRNDRVLDIGFGYGRDIPFLIRQGCQVYGIDPSAEGNRQAQARLRQAKLQSEQLVVGNFEEYNFPDNWFDAIITHRFIHLLESPAAISYFVVKVTRILREEGLLCIGVRNIHNLGRNGMVLLEEEGIYEQKHHSKHQFGYWDDNTFRDIFNKNFNILALNKVTESTSSIHQTPCHMTIMIAMKKIATNFHN